MFPVVGSTEAQVAPSRRFSVRSIPDCRWASSHPPPAAVKRVSYNRILSFRATATPCPHPEGVRKCFVEELLHTLPYPPLSRSRVSDYWVLETIPHVKKYSFHPPLTKRLPVKVRNIFLQPKFVLLCTSGSEEEPSNRYNKERNKNDEI